jgi:mRNA interferase RelE/StbE
MRTFLVFKLLYTDEARKQILKIKDAQIKDVLRQALEQIAGNPSIGKPLTKQLKGRYSYRVRDYRIIYRVFQDRIIVVILIVGHRRDVYKHLGRKGY